MTNYCGPVLAHNNYNQKGGLKLCSKIDNKNLYKSLHIFNREGMWLGLDTISGALFGLNDILASIVNKKIEGLGVNEIASKLDISLEEIHDELSDFEGNLKAFRQKQNYEVSNPSPKTMMLLVSQTCNMSCLYCYADTGTYNQNNPEKMDLDCAKNALDLASEIGIENIQFVGGEPLLAFDLIKKVVKYSNDMGYTFQFGVITNGTCIDEEVATFFKNHNVQVTVSIDGPKKVHDTCRQYPNGQGTFDQVVEGIKLLNSKRIPLSLQPVYGKRYIPLASPKEILSYLKSHCKNYILGYVMPVGTTYTSEDIMDETEVIQYFNDTIDFCFDSNLNDIPFIDVSIYKVIKHIYSENRFIKKYVCESLAKRLSVFSNGDIYPCQFANQPENCLGNVNNSTKDDVLEKRNNVLEKFTVDKLDLLARNLGDICIGHIQKDNNGDFKLKLPKAYNEFYEHLLYRIATTDMNKIFDMWRDYFGPKESVKETS